MKKSLMLVYLKHFLIETIVHLVIKYRQQVKQMGLAVIDYFILEQFYP